MVSIRVCAAVPSDNAANSIFLFCQGECSQGEAAGVAYRTATGVAYNTGAYYTAAYNTAALTLWPGCRLGG
jgi:hypothetical protein